MNERMQSDAEALAHAMRASGQSDHFFVALFGVAQSTVSRLRAQKIRKVSKYINKMVEVGELRIDAIDDIEASMKALAMAARGDPELAEALHALKKFVHKFMQ